MRRVLITGSRHWVDADEIAAVLITLTPDDVVIHGACETGADAMADSIASQLGIPIERYPANWKKYGASAGPIRNSEMIAESKPTEAHAFPLESSRGTWDCVRRCERAGVPVVFHEQEDDEL